MIPEEMPSRVDDVVFSACYARSVVPEMYLQMTEVVVVVAAGYHS